MFEILAQLASEPGGPPAWTFAIGGILAAGGAVAFFKAAGESLRQAREQSDGWQDQGAGWQALVAQQTAQHAATLADVRAELARVRDDRDDKARQLTALQTIHARCPPTPGGP